jgi:hypothetical protein
MIPVAVREDDALNHPEINTEPRGVALEDFLLWPCVEEDRVLALAAIGSDETRQTMSGTADTAA